MALPPVKSKASAPPPKVELKLKNLGTIPEGEGVIVHGRDGKSVSIQVFTKTGINDANVRLEGVYEARGYVLVTVAGGKKVHVPLPDFEAAEKAGVVWKDVNIDSAKAEFQAAKAQRDSEKARAAAGRLSETGPTPGSTVGKSPIPRFAGGPSKAKGLIAADIPRRAGPSPKVFDEKPGIVSGDTLVLKTTTGEDIKMKGLKVFQNYHLMDPATRDRHIPEGSVLVKIGGKHLIVKEDAFKDIHFLESQGGSVIIRH